VQLPLEHVDEDLANRVTAAIVKEIKAAMYGAVVPQRLSLAGRTDSGFAIRVARKQRAHAGTAIDELAAEPDVRDRVSVQVDEAAQWLPRLRVAATRTAAGEEGDKNKGRQADS
jgi:hypothetical protein